MGPGSTRKSRSKNKQYTYINEVSLSKDGEGAKRSNIQKRKLSDLLGHRWTQEELTRFYEAYRRHGKDWKKVAGAVQSRSSEMVEALYKMYRAYLSLPDGIASAEGMVAMMIDYYINLEGSDSDQENNDGAGSSQKTQKRPCGNVQLTNTSEVSNKQFALHSQTIESSYDCLSLLNSGGTRPRPFGRRTPRLPVSFMDKSIKREKSISPTRQGLKIKANDNDDEVAREIAIALAEASKKGCSPQVFQTPSKRAVSVSSSPFLHDHRKHSVAETGDPNLFATDTDKLSRSKPHIVEPVSCSMAGQKGRKLAGKKYEFDNNDENHLNGIKEECSGTEEGERFGSTGGKFHVEVTDAKSSMPSMHNQRKKSKKILFRRDEGPAFDALQTLAHLSLAMPIENEDGSMVLFKDENDDHVDKSLLLEALPTDQRKGKRRSSGIRMKGHKPMSSLEVAFSKTSKPGKGSVVDGSSVPEENQDPYQPKPKTTRKKQKIPASMIQKAETCPDIHLSEYPWIEAGNAGKKFVSKSKNSSQNSDIESSSSANLQKEGSHLDQSAVLVPVVNKVNLPTSFRSRHKMDFKRQLVQKDLKFPDKISNNDCNLPFTTSHTAFKFEEKLSSCLSNQPLRKWCAHEWFYNAIDYPWFAKKEFVEYLYHVGLGHVPRLTRVEWGIIRSSLGKPRRFSEQFLKEENDKLYQYRDSVRKCYTELREGVRSGLPTDLARPLSVGQRVVAFHPKTREIHDGSVLTVDSSRCRVQFDRHDLGVEFVMDIDCMPLNPSENKPALFEKDPGAVDKFFDNFNEQKINGQSKECMNLSTDDNLDNTNDISQLSPLANRTSVMMKKVGSSNATVETRIGPSESATYQQTACSQQSTLVQIQAKEADVQALAELTCALDMKEAVVLELKHMNGDVLENQKDGNSTSKDSEPFRKKHAAMLLQLNEANEQVSSALYCLRQRNTYQGNSSLAWPRLVSGVADPGGPLSSSDYLAFQTQESGSPVTEAINISRTKAQTMVVAAMQAVSSLNIREATVEKFEEAIHNNINDQLPSDDSCMPAAPDSYLVTASDIEAKIPSMLITKCVATLLMIQKCTHRQFPPSDVARILDYAVTSLHPLSSQNRYIYSDIQKCMGIIRNQIMALIPT